MLREPINEHILVEGDGSTAPESLAGTVDIHERRLKLAPADRGDRNQVGRDDDKAVRDGFVYLAGQDVLQQLLETQCSVPGKHDERPVAGLAPDFIDQWFRPGMGQNHDRCETLLFH